MGKHLVSQSQTLADRELAQAVMSASDWDSAYMATKHKSAVVRATREELERSTTISLLHFEPKLDGSLSAKVKAHLNTIGAVMRPDLSTEQAQSWVNAMVIKLSDLPPLVAAKATERALHVPFQYPSEVEAKLREFADEHVERIRMAVHRLKVTEQAIYEAMNPKPRIADNWTRKTGEPMTTQEVHELQQTQFGPGLISLGLKLGYITSDQLIPTEE
jgi:hypothetical protein